jgi:hypothetical protein
MTTKRKPGRPKGTGNDYNERLQVHLKPGGRDRLRKLAKAQGLNLSQYVRRLLGEE